MTAEFTTQGDIGNKTSTRRTVEEAASDLRSGVSEYLNRGKERLVQMEEGVEGYVQEHPIRSILIAAGVGVVVGALISRR